MICPPFAREARVVRCCGTCPNYTRFNVSRAFLSPLSPNRMQVTDARSIWSAPDHNLAGPYCRGSGRNWPEPHDEYRPRQTRLSNHTPRIPGTRLGQKSRESAVFADATVRRAARRRAHLTQPFQGVRIRLRLTVAGRWEAVSPRHWVCISLFSSPPRGDIEPLFFFERA